MHEHAYKTIIKPLDFKSGGYTLKGFIHLPDIPNPPVVIGSHGLFSTGDSIKQQALAKACNALGMGFFRFDHRGSGASEGVFKEVTTLRGRHADLVQAIHTIRGLAETGDKIGIFGSSMGGATALSVVSEHDNIHAVVTVAAPVRSRPVLNAAQKSNDLRGLPLSFYREKLHFDLSGKLSGISKILLFHGDQDDVVPVSNAHEIFNTVSKPKKMIIQEKGDHQITAPDHQKEFIREASNWFDIWLNGHKKHLAT